jgi:crotonobetainyl-CoA:carnitine CoA-transferase CaiB-like acyl-CoA transferase
VRPPTAEANSRTADPSVFAGEGVQSEIRKIFRSKTREQWTEIFAAEDACVDPVLGLGEALESQSVKDRQMVVDVPTETGETIWQIGSL